MAEAKQAAACAAARREMARLAADTLPYLDPRMEKRERPVSGRFIDAITLTIGKATLFRGCRDPDLRSLGFSSLSPIAGVYLSLDEKAAERYALYGIGVRMGDGWNSRPPVLYTCEVRDARLLDLSSTADDAEVLGRGFDRFINTVAYSGSLKALESLRSDWSALEMELLHDRESFLSSMKGMDHGFMAGSHNDLKGVAAEYISALGADGLLGDDDNVIILDPKRVSVLSERRVAPAP